MTDKPGIGFTCAYTPLALIHAAGFMPHRILPLGQAPDQAGTLLHDNLCPHVKRVLDRAMERELPKLAGMVLMNSCDSMRRLSDGWQASRPDDRLAFLDLPVGCDSRAVEYFAGVLADFAVTLTGWGGRPVSPGSLVESAALYHEMAAGLGQLEDRVARGTFVGGRKALQELHNQAVAGPPERFLEKIRRMRVQTEVPLGTGMRVPVFLFGNVMPDPEAFDLLESCGVQVVADDLCTAGRQLSGGLLDPAGDVFGQLSRAILSRPPCARTTPGPETAAVTERVLDRAKACGARGVIAQVIKFCDPYLARMPEVSRALKEAGLPLLVLEGDCTLRSLGQQRTRIEAFVEMLGGGPS